MCTMLYYYRELQCFYGMMAQVSGGPSKKPRSGSRPVHDLGVSLCIDRLTKP